MEHGDIVKVLHTEQYGIVLRVEDSMLFILHYDFSTSWEQEEDCMKVGSSDAIFKVMYEIKSCELNGR